MKEPFKIYRFPEINEGGGSSGELPEVEEGEAGEHKGSVIQGEPVVESVPRSKDDWDKLSRENPQRWISLTQARMDQTVRQAREAQEKLVQEQVKARNLAMELETLRKGQVGEVAEEGKKDFSRENLPQTDADWENLWIENPNKAADLRHFKNERDVDVKRQQHMVQQEFVKTWDDSARVLQLRHPDMYVLEKDETGNIKVDEHGNSVLRINPATGVPILDESSEKGKLFTQIYNEDPAGFSGTKFGPRLAMLELERRLQERGEQKIGSTGNNGGQSETAVPDQRGVLSAGVNAPVGVRASFKTDEEKSHVMKAIERGVYKSAEEYCRLRDGKSIGIEEENSFPKFN